MRQLMAVVVCAVLLCAASGHAKWSGVDEQVVEKYAEEHGRSASAPLIDTTQGDMLLFVFLLAGAAGGFAAGYFWRTLMDGAGGRRPAGASSTTGNDPEEDDQA